MYRQQGLSLVELMISMTLGIVLMTGVMQMFLTSRVTYSNQQAISRIQESGRMAVDFLAQDIRMAGYMGCMNRNANIMNGLQQSEEEADRYLYDFDVGIEGFPFDGHPLTGLEGVTPVAGSDVVIIRRAGSDDLPIEGPTGEKANLDVAANANGKCVGEGPLCVDDIAVASDCTQGRIFQVSNLTDIGGGGTRIVHTPSSTPGNLDSHLGGQQFPPGAEVLSLNTIAYFVAGSSFSPGVRSLWQKVGQNPPVELVEGVERMRLNYGRDTTNDCVPDTYQSADSLSGDQWQSVSAVRLNLLMQSRESNVLPDPQSLEFFGENLANDVIADRRMRQVFTSTIGIRSRLTDSTKAEACNA